MFGTMLFLGVVAIAYIKVWIRAYHSIKGDLQAYDQSNRKDYKTFSKKNIRKF